MAGDRRAICSLCRSRAADQELLLDEEDCKRLGWELQLLKTGPKLNCIRLWTKILRSLTFLMKYAQAYRNLITETSADLNLQRVKDIGPSGKQSTRCRKKLL